MPDSEYSCDLAASGQSQELTFANCTVGRHPRYYGELNNVWKPLL